VTPAELLAAQMVAADPRFAHQIAGKLAQDLLERLQAGRHVDPAVRELTAALLRALSGQAEPVPQPVPQPEPVEPAPADSMLAIEQVAEALGCSTGYARRLARKGPDQGGIKASRVGATWVVRAADLDEYTERRRGKEPAA
jgi:excisionase family DNA binding protein